MYFFCCRSSHPSLITYPLLVQSQQTTTTSRATQRMYQQQQPSYNAFPRPAPKQLDANQVQVLQKLGFTSGLIHAVSNYSNAVPLRIWVVDNGISMQVRDGHRISGSTFQSLQTSDCTRWEEAQDRVAFHAYMAGVLGIPTRFNLVDHTVLGPGVPSCFSIAERGPAAVQTDIQTAKQVMTQAQPVGRATPLAFHIMEIRKMIVQMAPQLAREGKLVSVILVTCGLPTDSRGQPGPAALQEFTQALRSLEGLPVTLVVRLCTDDERVVDYYNTIDSRINLSFDVLDDHNGEAIEVYLKNPWLNYSLPLHQFRELGFSIPVFDEIDEQALSPRELHQLCALLFQTQQPLPDPAMDWINFLRALAQVMSREKMYFNPITKSIGPWIDLRRLHYVYGRGMPFPQDVPVPQQYYQPPPPPQPQPTVGQPWQQQQQQYPQAQGFAGSQHQYQQQQQHSYQQQQQATPPRPTKQHAPPPAAAPAPEASVAASKYRQQGSEDENMTAIKRGILTWATVPPAHQQLKPIDQLLGTIPQTFPPAFGITEHAYFKKWKPFSLDALQDRDETVLKRGKIYALLFNIKCTVNVQQ